LIDDCYSPCAILIFVSLLIHTIIFYSFQVDEHMAGRDDGREYGSGRSKGATTPANGQGKPKKGGRPGGRDGKRIRPSNDPDLDDEEDF
jgi:hypothetical protein